MLIRSLLIAWFAVWSGHAGANEVRLSITEGTNFSITQSADGTQLTVDLLGSLWLLDKEGGKATRLTDPTEIEARLPRWSPQDKRIAFQGFKDGFWHIFLLDPENNALRQLTSGSNDHRAPRWHPGFERLVFSSDRDGPDGIYEIDLESGEISQLVNKTSPVYGPAWSNNGKTLAYIEAGRSGSKVVLREADDSERVLLERPGNLDGLSWHPNDTSITFVQTLDEATGLFLADLSREGVLQLSDTGDDVFPFPAVWESEQDLIYTVQGKINRLALNTFAQDTIPFEAEISLARQDYNRKNHNFTSTDPQPVKGLLGPVLSPDGERLAFTALGDLWIQNIGGALTQVTNSPALELDPNWAPDGDSLVYVSDANGVMDIWQIDLSSGDAKQVTKLQSGATAPVLSPDGQSIAFIQALGNPGLGPALPAILDLATGKSRPLSTPLWGPGRPAWSPDGRWITVSAQPDPNARIREGRNQILLLSKDGKEKHWLAAPSGKSLAMRNRNGPLWIANDQIVFVEGGNLWRATLAQDEIELGSQERLLQRPGLISSVSVSADRSNVSFLENDLLKIAQLSKLPMTGEPKTVALDLKWSHDIPTERKVIHAGRLFDGVSGNYQTNMDIVIDGNVITAIKPHAPSDPSIEFIDASEQTVIPGLFDMHVHQHAGLGERLGRVWLAFGITSVREPGANPYDALERKESWASGSRPGPREFFAGGQLDGPLTYFAFSHPTSDMNEINMEMQRAEILDYDFIKTYIRLSDNQRKAVIERAHGLGLGVTAHDFFPAAAFGGDGVEHMRGTSRRGFSPKLSNTNRAYEDVVKIIGAAGMTQTPTLVVRGGFALLARNDSTILANPQYQALYPTGQRKMMEGMAFGIAGDLERARTRLDRHFDDVKRLQENGARITAGTDVPIVPYGLSLHVELQLLNNAGLTPAQVLQSASLNAAESLGVDNWLGSLEVGKLADLVIIDGDPLNTIGDSKNVSAVVKNGHVYEVEALTAARSTPNSAN